jgi:nicotinate-nucleotide pyrophosphorylase (carboxylating)
LWPRSQRTHRPLRAKGKSRGTLLTECGQSLVEIGRRERSLFHGPAQITEIDGLDQLEEALAHAPDVILLDNFTLPDLARAVALTNGRAVLEASGGVSLASVRAIAETGIDVISVGALTHSAPALDIGLDAV